MFSLHLFLFSLICALPASTTAAPDYALPGSEAIVSDNSVPESIAAAPDYDSSRCTAATKSVENGCEKSKTCYKFSNLFYTPPEQICSCLDQTVGASKKVAGECASTRDEKAPYKFSPNDVYVGWSNKDAANAACSKCKEGIICIKQIGQILIHVQTEKLGIKVTDMPNKIKCEEPCFKQLYKSCDGKGDLAPTLYFYGGGMTQDVFASWKKYCKWDDY